MLLMLTPPTMAPVLRKQITKPSCVGCSNRSRRDGFRTLPPWVPGAQPALEHVGAVLS